MTDRRKIPAAPPARPSAASPDATGQGVTETQHHGLKTPAHSNWCRCLLALEGSAPLDLDLDALRRDGA